jgi:uncharacterized membrane protein
MSFLFGLIVIAANPPLRGPDEPAHFWRAVGIAQGDLIPTTSNERGHVGLFITADWHRQFSHFNEIRQTPPSERPNYWQVFRSYFAHETATGEDTAPIFVTYEGSQVYSPVGYIPYAASAFVAKALDLSFLWTLYLLRLTGLIVSSAMIAYAISITPFLKWTFVCVAMLPTALYQRAVVSIDGVVLGATLLVIGLCLAAVLAPGRLLLRGLWITLSSLTKPPQVAFVLLEAMRIPLGAWRAQWRSFCLITVPSLALAFGWIVIALLDVPAWWSGSAAGLPSGDRGTLRKLRLLVTHPDQFVAAAITTVLDDSVEMWKQLIGVFGWLDTAMLNWAYPLLSALLLASFIDNSEFSRPVRTRIALVALVTAMIYCVGVLAVFFVTETPTGAARIYGLQGRYFIVVVPVAAVIVSALLNRSLGRGRSWVAITSSLVSVAAMMEALWRVHWAS